MYNNLCLVKNSNNRCEMYTTITHTIFNIAAYIFYKWHKHLASFFQQIHFHKITIITQSFPNSNVQSPSHTTNQITLSYHFSQANNF